jgi:hypothetical protein
MVEFDATEGLGVLGGGLAILGGFLPWITWVSGSVTGLDRNGGLTVVLGAVAVGVVLLATMDRRSGLVLAGIGVLVLFVGGRAYLDMQDAIGRIDVLPGVENLAQIEPGIGLYLTLAGGAIVTAAGVLAVWWAGERAGTAE